MVQGSIRQNTEYGVFWWSNQQKVNTKFMLIIADIKLATADWQII